MEYRALGAVVCLSAMLGCTAIQLKLRQPGERLVSFTEPGAVEYDCAKRRLPFFKVEESELIPSRLRPGGQLNHRFVYVMCPSRASEVIEGKLDATPDFVIALNRMLLERLRMGRNTVLIIDEAQNLTPHEVKTVITRAGEGAPLPA